MDTGCIPPTVNFFQYTSIASIVPRNFAKTALKIEGARAGYKIRTENAPIVVRVF